MELTYRIYKSTDIGNILEELGKLRIEIFREFPYLYEGTMEYERGYLKTYIEAERSMVVTVFDGKDMIGASSCLPMSEEGPEVQMAFLEAKKDISKIFYFGESILMPKYRGLGIGNIFFDEREKHALSFKNYDFACFCAVERPENHLSKPSEFRPLKDFWIKRGYKKQEQLRSFFKWKDINESDETEKLMIFWTKDLRWD